MNDFSKVNEVVLDGKKFMVLSKGLGGNEFIIMGMEGDRPISLTKDALTDDVVKELIKRIGG